MAVDEDGVEPNPNVVETEIPKEAPEENVRGAKGAPLHAQLSASCVFGRAAVPTADSPPHSWLASCSLRARCRYAAAGEEEEEAKVRR